MSFDSSDKSENREPKPVAQVVKFVNIYLIINKLVERLCLRRFELIFAIR